MFVSANVDVMLMSVDIVLHININVDTVFLDDDIDMIFMSLHIGGMLVDIHALMLE